MPFSLQGVTENVIDMNCMFALCTSLEEINLSKFNSCKVKDMSYMFYDCYSIKNIIIYNFNTDNVINMNHMLDLCSDVLKNKIIALNENIKI